MHKFSPFDALPVLILQTVPALEAAKAANKLLPDDSSIKSLVEELEALCSATQGARSGPVIEELD